MRLANRVKAVIANELDISAELLTDDSQRDMDMLAWDSFSHINIMLSLEREFEVSFCIKEFNELISVSQLISAIEKKI